MGDLSVKGGSVSFRPRTIFSYSFFDAADLTWTLMGFAKDQPMPKCVFPGSWCGGSAVKHRKSQNLMDVSLRLV